MFPHSVCYGHSNLYVNSLQCTAMYVKNSGQNKNQKVHTGFYSYGCTKPKRQLFIKIIKASLPLMERGISKLIDYFVHLFETLHNFKQLIQYWKE